MTYECSWVIAGISWLLRAGLCYRFRRKPFRDLRHHHLFSENGAVQLALAAKWNILLQTHRYCACSVWFVWWVYFNEARLILSMMAMKSTRSCVFWRRRGFQAHCFAILHFSAALLLSVLPVIYNQTEQLSYWSTCNSCIKGQKICSLNWVTGRFVAMICRINTQWHSNDSVGIKRHRT